jgi:hypothetical protein
MFGQLPENDNLGPMACRASVPDDDLEAVALELMVIFQD